MRVINWGPAPGDPDFWRRVLTDPNIVWLAVLSGLVGSTAAFGTDHDLMQRVLTVETRRASQRTLALTPLGTLATLAIYLSIGAGLFAYYAQHPGAALPRPDEIFPFFIRTAMPEMLRGLLLAAIVLASIDSPLGSLAASFVTDVYRPLLARDRSEAHYLRVSRAAVAGFGLALALLAWGFSFFDRILWLAFKIAGVTFGSLLGVFLLGLVTPRAGQPRQRRGHGRDGPCQPGPPDPVRAPRGPARLVVAGDPRHRRDHGAGGRARPRARRRPGARPAARGARGRDPRRRVRSAL